jgi:hypothetical protein
VVDAVHDVLQRALARRGQENPGNAGAREVLRQAFFVAPFARVVDNDGVVDAVPRVIDTGRVSGVDHLDERAIGEDGVILLIDGDRALERAVHRVAAQQTGTFHQVVGGTTAHDDRTQAQALAAAAMFDQDAGQQPADATEAVEHDVGTGAIVESVLADDVGEFTAQVFLQGDAPILLPKAEGEPGEVDRRCSEVEAVDSLQNRQGLFERKLDIRYMAGEPVCFEQAHDRLVDQAATVDARHDGVVPVEAPDQGDHRLSESLAITPRCTGTISVLDHRVAFLNHRWLVSPATRGPGVIAYSSSASSLGSSKSFDASSSTLTSLKVSTRTDFTNRSER